MRDSSSTYSLRARWLFPVSSPPISGGVLTISGGRIVAFGENLSGQPPRDLGNVALLPGLVNAHTHLEFSDLPAPLGTPLMRFPDWIRAVIEHRRKNTVSAGEAAEPRALAVAVGLAESIVTGTAALGEIATPGWPSEAFAAPWPDSTVFLELLGLGADRIEPLCQLAFEHLALAKSQGIWRPGLSPHAPYSVHFDLFRRVCRLSAESGAPLAMHLAESVEELELLASHSGPFHELLCDLGVWNPGAIPRGIRPLDYLKELATAARALVVHGNYLTYPELEFLAQQHERLSLIYCPRTHAYFGHGRYPLRQALALGVNVALGTDSRASNPDLSLWREMQHVARVFPEVSPADVLRLGTINGAKALGVEAEFGSLQPGRQSRLCAVPLPESAERDPYEMLFALDEAVAI